MLNRAIIIQGQSNYVQELKRAWTGFDIIWSTWVGEESKYMDSDIVVFNEPETNPGVGNIALQKQTTLSGLKKAKELGYCRALKWRSDIVPSNPYKICELFKDGSLNFLAWHSDGYFVDYFTEGSVEDLYTAWNLKSLEGPFPENIFTRNIISSGLNHYHFIGNSLNQDLEIYWSKYGINLSSYKDNSCYSFDIKYEDIVKLYNI